MNGTWTNALELKGAFDEIVGLKHSDADHGIICALMILGIDRLFDPNLEINPNPGNPLILVRSHSDESKGIPGKGNVPRISRPWNF